MVLNMLKHKKRVKESEFCIDFPMDRKVLHYPTLKTVLMVESVIRKSNLPVNKNEIKRKLKAKIMHQTLNIILSYLEERGMIIRAKDGYVWIYNPSPKLEKAIREGREI